ncbi:hypothetical protein BGW80DRAFT_367160 [Lactifluus volemus]|nr:hypothetical protein BGW80DRAFT_367160 [Lactifluus volemus]
MLIDSDLSKKVKEDGDAKPRRHSRTVRICRSLRARLLDPWSWPHGSASARGRQKETASRADDDEHVVRRGDGSVEVSWVPTLRFWSADAAEEDDLVLGGSGRRPRRQDGDVLCKGLAAHGVFFWLSHCSYIISI